MNNFTDLDHITKVNEGINITSAALKDLHSFAAGMDEQTLYITMALAPLYTLLSTIAHTNLALLDELKRK